MNQPDNVAAAGSRLLLHRNSRARSAPALLAVAALTLVVGVSAATAGSGSQSQNKTIGISFPNATKEGAVQHEMTFAKARAKELGYKLVVDDPGQDLNHQLNTINTWIQQDFKSIITVALNPGAFGNVVKNATSKGVNWFTYGSSLPGETGQINLEQIKGGMTIGKLAGTWLKTHVPGKAQVALLTYSAGAWARAREQGIIQGLKATDPQAQIVARQDALSESEGLSVTTPILQAHPDLNAVLAIEETASEGAYQAFINTHHAKNDPKVFIGGIDGTLRALKLLKEGNTMYRGSAALSLKQLGVGMAETAARGTGSYHVKYTPLTPGSPTVTTFLREWGQ